jgi:callose synthase
MATRLWASYRAQTLARTVQGMMMYEKALRLLMELERVESDAIDNLACEKFNYVVAAQVLQHSWSTYTPLTPVADRCTAK